MFCGGWFTARFGLSTEINAIPADDLRAHEAGAGCWCKPELDDNEFLVHRSLDGREAFEAGMRKPS